MEAESTRRAMAANTKGVRASPTVGVLIAIRARAISTANISESQSVARGRVPRRSQNVVLSPALYLEEKKGFLGRAKAAGR
jgi:hypothetical protein